MFGLLLVSVLCARIVVDTYSASWSTPFSLGFERLTVGKAGIPIAVLVNNVTKTEGLTLICPDLCLVSNGRELRTFVEGGLSVVVPESSGARKATANNVEGFCHAVSAAFPGGNHSSFVVIIGENRERDINLVRASGLNVLHIACSVGAIGGKNPFRLPVHIQEPIAKKTIPQSVSGILVVVSGTPVSQIEWLQLVSSAAASITASHKRSHVAPDKPRLPSPATDASPGTKILFVFSLGWVLGLLGSAFFAALFSVKFNVNVCTSVCATCSCVAVLHQLCF